MQGEIQLEELTKRFGDVVAVDGIDLHMPAGEFFTMVGPSGCGKTTTLRMIAGFERPDERPDRARRRRRRAGAAAQAQREHGVPELRAVPASRRRGQRRLRAQVPAADEGGAAQAGRPRRSTLVQLGDYAKRKPGQLSGGQQQRVALARALVLTPRVLLLDEPLGALDARLRKDLQVELKALQAELGITFVFVTHDQEEALTMSDRVAVMNGGRVEQAGSPKRDRTRSRRRCSSPTSSASRTCSAPMRPPTATAAPCGSASARCGPSGRDRRPRRASRR